MTLLIFCTNKGHELDKEKKRVPISLKENITHQGTP